ncbi:hypothetical protein LP419_01340 [Massilia sp. H-1]|nr:hypothetical protein LP419_01340 [Massilia sp. H-1]
MLVLACLLPTMIGFGALSYDSYNRERAKLLLDADRMGKSLLASVERDLETAETAARAGQFAQPGQRRPGCLPCPGEQHPAPGTVGRRLCLERPRRQAPAQYPSRLRQRWRPMPTPTPFAGPLPAARPRLQTCRAARPTSLTWPRSTSRSGAAAKSPTCCRPSCRPTA